MSGERGPMARPSQDVTEAELAILRALWDRGPATIRQLAEAIYAEKSGARYTTVQKLLDRLEEKEYVRRDRGSSPHVFASSIDRDELIGRRLRAVAEQLCDGSLVPLLTHLVKVKRLTPQEQRALRALIESPGDRP